MTTATSKPETGSEGATENRWLRAYRQMVRIRLFEEQVNELYTRALMPGLAHLYSGEEAVAVGICEALRVDDYITSTHRGHGHCLAKGASARPHVRRVAGQGSWLLPGQGRIDAYCRSRYRQPGRERDCRRERWHRDRSGVCREATGERSCRRLFFWRRRSRSGIALRSNEPRATLEAARDLRLRKQSLQRVHTLLGDNGRDRFSDALQLSGSSRLWSTDRTCAR